MKQMELTRKKEIPRVAMWVAIVAISINLMIFAYREQSMHRLLMETQLECIRVIQLVAEELEEVSEHQEEIDEILSH